MIENEEDYDALLAPSDVWTQEKAVRVNLGDLKTMPDFAITLIDRLKPLFGSIIPVCYEDIMDKDVTLYYASYNYSIEFGLNYDDKDSYSGGFGNANLYEYSTRHNTWCISCPIHNDRELIDLIIENIKTDLTAKPDWQQQQQQ
jgi:hypothetical protein